MSSGDRRRLPDHLPILDGKLSQGRYLPVYREREITAPVDLCDESGRLNPMAVGWSRQPQVRANLSGHWLRKKRWNFWNWISPEFVFSVTLADIDYASFCAVSFTDFASGEEVNGIALGRPGRFPMPEQPGRSVSFHGGGLEYVHVDEGGDQSVKFSGSSRDGRPLEADFVVRPPPGQESLNVVVPWTPDHFQLNSKHNTLPCEGTVRVAGRTYSMDPRDCHAVQDFGRGIWPYRSCWNWAVCTGEQDGRRIGVNMGARWTTGTGANENGIIIDGRLHKVMEDLHWSYSPEDWMRPWRVRTVEGDAIDLTLTPQAVNRSKLDAGVLSTRGACAFGSWNGRIGVEGENVEIRGLTGWAEEFAHRW